MVVDSHPWDTHVTHISTLATFKGNDSVGITFHSTGQLQFARCDLSLNLAMAPKHVPKWLALVNGTKD